MTTGLDVKARFLKGGVIMAKGLSGYDAAVEGLVFKAILPSQLLIGQWNAHCQTGVWRLMYAVLMDAVISLLQNKGVRDDDLKWVCSESKSHPFTFENVCEALKLDPGATRARLIERWHQAQLEKGTSKKTPPQPLIRRHHVSHGRSGNIIPPRLAPFRAKK